MAKYKFFKDSKLERPRNISYETFMSSSYGEEFEYNLDNNSNPWKIYHHINPDSDKYLYSLKNIINYYSGVDDLYNFNNFLNKPYNLLTLNSYYMGSGFIPGTISIDTYLSGTLLDRATDSIQNGVLYNKNSEKVGIVLYKEGFILLNNTSSLTDNIIEFSDGSSTFTDKLSWVNTFLSASNYIDFDISYLVKNNVSVNTYFAPVEKYDLNYSNNPTYIESGSYRPVSGSVFFKENEDIKIKNISKSPFVGGNANFQKHTFITKIGLYDDEKKLIAVGNLANPIKKDETREYIFKLRLDI